MVPATSVRARIFKTVFVVVVGVVFVPFAWYGWMVWKFCGPNDQIHKYLMPGNYRTYLPAGKYGGWYFDRWQSKQIKSDPLARHEVTIAEDTGEMVPQEKVIDGPGDEYDDKKGKGDFFFEVTKAGEYSVSSKSTDRFVFVIVPEKERFLGLGSSYTFEGIGGDFNFEKVIAE